MESQVSESSDASATPTGSETQSTTDTHAQPTTATPSGTPSEDDVDSKQAELESAFDELFDRAEPLDIEITFGEADWLGMRNDWLQDSEKRYYSVEVKIGDETLDEVGVRFKGWSSLANGSGNGGGPLKPSGSEGNDGKFPLVLNFDHFGGPRFHGIDQLSLSNNWADISYMRERLAARMFNEMGVHAGRTTYAKVTIDGEYRGIYTVAQKIDKRFLRERFGSNGGADDGNLYKAVFSNSEPPGRLQYHGDSAQDYIRTTGCPEGFDTCGILLKTNESEESADDYDDFLAFVSAINLSDDDSFAEEIAEVLNVDNFLRLMAVGTVIANTDGYFGMGHNYYLYVHPGTGKFTMIPWDLNESYAGHPCGIAPLHRQPYLEPVCGADPSEFPLVSRVLEVPEFRETYSDYVAEIVDTLLTEEQHGEWIEEFDTMIGDEIGSDPNYITTVENYRTALSDTESAGLSLGGHGGFEYNLLDFVVQRRNFLVDDLTQP